MELEIIKTDTTIIENKYQKLFNEIAFDLQANGIQIEKAPNVLESACLLIDCIIKYENGTNNF